MALPLMLTPPPASCLATTVVPRRIVAVGDIHGDLRAFLRVLKIANLIDSNGRWAGGDTTLVQVSVAKRVCSVRTSALLSSPAVSCAAR